MLWGSDVTNGGDDGNEIMMYGGYCIVLYEHFDPTK